MEMFNIRTLRWFFIDNLPLKYLCYFQSLIQENNHTKFIFIYFLMISTLSLILSDKDSQFVQLILNWSTLSILKTIRLFPSIYTDFITILKLGDINNFKYHLFCLAWAWYLLIWSLTHWIISDEDSQFVQLILNWSTA